MYSLIKRVNSSSIFKCVNWKNSLLVLVNQRKIHTNSRKRLNLITFTACTFGFGIGYIVAKYPILLMKLGVQNKSIDSFITQPEIIRSENVDVNNYIKIVEAIMQIAEQAVLSTTAIDSKSAAQPCAKARMVHPFPPAPGIPNLYFTTNKLSRKFHQICENSQAVLTYYDKEGAGYVSVEGHADVLSDVESTSLWKDHLLLFYPEGPVTEETPLSRFVVIRFVPKRIEFCSVRFGVETAHDSWYPAALIVDDNGSWCADSDLSIL